MAVDDPHRVAVAFAREVARAPGARLCAACVDALQVAGAGITLMGGDRVGPICVSDASSAMLEEFQYSAGEGPCRDAYAQRRFVHAPRLDSTAIARWPSFVELAATTGIRAVFAYPLGHRSTQVGVLTLYQDAEGELTEDQHSDSLAMAEVLAETVLTLQSAAPAGTLAPSLEEAAAHRAEIHQASGMVSVQLGVTVDEARARIRAHAFARGTTASDVARDVVARRLTFGPDVE